MGPIFHYSRYKKSSLMMQVVSFTWGQYFTILGIKKKFFDDASCKLYMGPIFHYSRYKKKFFDGASCKLCMRPIFHCSRYKKSSLMMQVVSFA